MGRGWRDKVNLTGEQRENLEQISRNGYAAAKKILHARILLMCDEGEQAKSNGVAYSKKKQLGLWKTQRYCILEQDLARFVAQMEVVLDLYGTQPSEEEPLIANVAETELSVLSRQCLDRRISSKEELKREIETWQKERNQTASTVIWTFTTSDARVKLKHLYPVFEQEESGESIAPN